MVACGKKKKQKSKVEETKTNKKGELKNFGVLMQKKMRRSTQSEKKPLEKDPRETGKCARRELDSDKKTQISDREEKRGGKEKTEKNKELFIHPKKKVRRKKGTEKVSFINSLLSRKYIPQREKEEGRSEKRPRNHIRKEGSARHDLSVNFPKQRGTKKSRWERLL